MNKLITFSVSFLSSLILFAGTPTEVEVSGFVTALSEKSVFVTEKHGVVLEVPRANFVKTNPKIRSGEFVKVLVEKSALKAAPAKNVFSKR